MKVLEDASPFQTGDFQVPFAVHFPGCTNWGPILQSDPASARRITGGAQIIDLCALVIDVNKALSYLANG